MPQIPLDAIDTTYVRNKWNLPGVDEASGRTGSIGSAIVRERKEVRRKEKEARKKTGVRGNEVKVRKKMPLLSGVNGRPDTDPYGRYFKRGSSQSSFMSATV